MLPGLRSDRPEQAKVRVTIALDSDLVEHFKKAASKRGALPYQTQITTRQLDLAGLTRRSLARGITGT